MLDETAHTDNVGDARHLAQSAFNHPVLLRAQVGGILTVAFDAVAHDFTDRRGIRHHVDLCACRHVNRVQSLVDLLTRNVDVGRIVIGDDSERQAELGVRENPNRVGQARQRDFNRQGNLLFNLFGGAAGVQRNHRDLGVGDVRESFD